MFRDGNSITLRFLKYLSPYWRKGLFAFMFMMISVALQLPMPFLTKYLIDDVIPTKSLRLLTLIGLSLTSIVLIRAISRFYQSFILSSFRGRVLFDIRLQLFDHIQKAALSYFFKKQTGYLMSQLSDDVNALQGLLAETLVSAGQNIITFIAGIICTIYIHPKLALICFLILPLYLLSLVAFNKRVRNLSYRTRENIALVNKDLQELLSGISLIKAFTAEGRSTLKLLTSIKTAIRSEIKLDIIATIASICSFLISSIGPLILIWYGCGEIIRGHLTVGGLLAFNFFIGFLFDPVRVLYDLNLSVQRSLAAVERVFEILDVSPEETGVHQIVINRGSILFKNVSFAYNSTYVLKEISFNIEPGQIVAIVGRSGAGKTTIISLLLKFYRQSTGHIVIDQQDISDISTKSLRDQIGLVAQDAFLFSDTVKENIRFGRPEATDREVEEAAKLAFAYNFIMDMPDGFKSKIGERGCILSGGQRQRLAIARAILKNPKILILDEATSQVDSEVELNIQRAIKQIMPHRTIITIAHRLSTVQMADKIIVIDHGSIVEEGIHLQLYKKGGVYYELCKAGLIETVQ